MTTNAKSSKPYDATNSTNAPWLMKCSGEPITLNGHKLTAEYIWSKQGADREALLDEVFNHYRKVGYPVFKLTDAELTEDFNQLKAANASSIVLNGTIKNSNTAGLDAAKHFTADLFLAAKSSGKSKSCLEVFNDDELFRKVLKNRMGWNVSSEDGTTRPYVFGLNDKMITQGMRSSGLAYSVSHFKPMIAKYIYEKYKVKKTLDYSCGWGARCVAAMSLGVEYYGLDPLTADRINAMIKYFGGAGFVSSGCSESTDYGVFPDVDLAFGSPPYFDLEIYAADETQSSHYTKYEDWLEKYWRETVKRCISKCKYFSFVGVEAVKKLSLLEDMGLVCEEEGCKLIESIPIKTTKGHLSGKKQSGSIDKKTEHIQIYEVKGV
jgi:hypothetical protein